jgi:hypothetical protein
MYRVVCYNLHLLKRLRAEATHGEVPKWLKGTVC